MDPPGRADPAEVEEDDVAPALDPVAADVDPPAPDEAGLLPADELVLADEPLVEAAGLSVADGFDDELPGAGVAEADEAVPAGFDEAGALEAVGEYAVDPAPV